MKRMTMLMAGALAALALFSVACGGGDGNSATATAKATPAASKTAAPSPSHVAGSPASKEELQKAFETARASLQEVITKAKAGDKKATQDAYQPADDPLHMIEDAVRDKGDTSLADSIEKKQHDGLEDPLKTGSPNLANIVAAAQEILPLLDQAAAKLNITAAAGGTASTAELKDHLTTIKAVMQDTMAKAKAGDVQGTRDAEGKGDVAMEAIIKALRPVDASLADKLENLELDYEGQADSANTDLTVIAKDTQDVLNLLGQVAAKLKITP